MSDLITFKIKDWVVFGRNKFVPPFKISDALINEARIVHVVHGKSRLFAADRNVDLNSGDTIIMTSDNFVNSWFANENGEANEVIAFQLNAEFLKHLYNNQIPSWFANKPEGEKPALEKVKRHVLIDDFFNSLTNYLNNKELLNEEVILLKIRELISLFIETDSTGKMRNIFANLFSPKDYNFQEVIQQNIFEDLGAEELAFLVGQSLSSFKRNFKSIYGTSPNKYITSKRLEKSQVLLKSTDLSISEIAYECGFSDVGYFSKVFKGHYQILPSEIRK